MLTKIMDFVPCAHCGATAILYQVDRSVKAYQGWGKQIPKEDVVSTFYVQCSNRYCGIMTAEDKSQEVVLAKWERRSPRTIKGTSAGIIHFPDEGER